MILQVMIIIQENIYMTHPILLIMIILKFQVLILNLGMIQVFTLDKIFDGSTNTYMHTKRNIIRNSENPLILIINCNNNITFNQMILKTYGANNYLPKRFTLYISDDNIKWNEIYIFNDLQLDSSRTLKLI